MFVEIRWKIGGLEPTQQSMCVDRMCNGFLEPDEQETESQPSHANPLENGESLTKQYVAEKYCHQQFSQPEQSGLHTANVFHTKKKHQP